TYVHPLPCRRSPAPPATTLPPYTTLFRSGPGHLTVVPLVPDHHLVGDAELGDLLPHHDRPALLVRLPDLHALVGVGLVDQGFDRSEEHTSELQSRFDLVCRLLLEKKKTAE